MLNKMIGYFHRSARWRVMGDLLRQILEESEGRVVSGQDIGRKLGLSRAAPRKRRDGVAVRAALGGIESACRGKVNVMGPILSAVRAYATLGEISDVMRSVFGAHQGKVTV